MGVQYLFIVCSGGTGLWVWQAGAATVGLQPMLLFGWQSCTHAIPHDQSDQGHLSKYVGRTLCSPATISSINIMDPGQPPTPFLPVTFSFLFERQKCWAQSPDAYCVPPTFACLFFACTVHNTASIPSQTLHHPDCGCGYMCAYARVCVRACAQRMCLVNSNPCCVCVLAPERFLWCILLTDALS